MTVDGLEKVWKDGEWHTIGECMRKAAGETNPDRRDTLFEFFARSPDAKTIGIGKDVQMKSFERLFRILRNRCDTRRVHAASVNATGSRELKIL